MFRRFIIGCVLVGAFGNANRVLVFDHYSTVRVLAILKSTGADIADDVVDQGAEGLDMRQRARRIGR